MAKGKIIKNMLLATLWTAIGAGTVVLLVAAIQQKDAKKCTDIDITIKGVSNNFFVDKNDILNTITSMSGGKPVGLPVGSFDLKALEIALQKNVWVKTAQLYFDNNEKLQVNVLEREPVARVFTSAGTTFYIDSAAAMLPLSEKFSARLPVFTNFPSDKKVLLRIDSNLLRDICSVSTAIQSDSFSMAMIDQVDITAQRTFEMIPKFGNTVIVFGDAKDATEKLAKLQLFYKQVMTKAGWNKYSEINIQYDNQVVGKRKGAAEVKADSLRTLQLMKVIAETAAKLSSDSLQTMLQDNEQNTTNNSIIQESIERDDNNPSANTNEESKPQDTVANEKSSANNPVKIAVPKPSATAKKPEAVKKPTVIKPGKANGTSIVKPNGKPIEKPKTTSAKTEDAKKPKMLMPKQLPKKAQPANEY